MKFIVTRTSTYGKGRPCWESVPETISYDCYGEQREENVWVVEFANLNELMRFKKKYGQLVITSHLHDENLQVIEIYDDYRE